MSDDRKYPPVLDACCGSRMFWFDRRDSRAVFVDKRQERHTLPDVSSAGGARELVIDPDHVADFTALPFPSDTFALVVFDPPHFERNGARSWVGLKYGTPAARALGTAPAREIARVLGVSVRTVARMRSGERIVRRCELRAIAAETPPARDAENTQKHGSHGGTETQRGNIASVAP